MLLLHQPVGYENKYKEEERKKKKKMCDTREKFIVRFQNFWSFAFDDCIDYIV